MLTHLAQLGGPGPATFAFRKLVRPSVAAVRGAHRTSAPTQAKPKRASPKGNKARATPTPAPAQQPVETVITALPPPALSNAKAREDDLVRYLSGLELERSLRIWSDFLVATDTFRDLRPETYEAISRFVIDILSKRSLDLGKWAAHDPERLETLLHMTVEAAVHDSWRGFNALQLELIGAGRPHDVVTAYGRFKERLFAHQGKDPKGLVSWYREERLASRLTGEGLIPLMLGYVAAQTMLGQFEHSALISLMDSAFDARLVGRDRLDLTAIRYQINSRANRGAGEDTWKQFLGNIDKVTLAIQCYHSKALVTRIRALARQGDSAKVTWIYESLMRASLGPDRFILPVDSGNRSANYNFVPLGMDVWGKLRCRTELTADALIDAYAHFKDVERVAHIVEVDMAARYPRIPTGGYGVALRSLSSLWSRGAKKPLLQKAERKINEYWAAIVERGEDMSLDSLDNRLESLTNLGKPAESEKLFRRAIIALVGRGEDAVDWRSRLAGHVFNAYCRAGRIGDAERLLRDVPAPIGPPSSVHRPFALGVLHAKAEDSVKRKLLTQVLARIGDAHVVGADWGRILELLLRSGWGIEATTDAIAPKQKLAPTVPARWWYSFLCGLTGNGGRGVSPSALAAATHILKTHFPRSESTNTSLFVLAWSVVQLAVARSDLSAADRHQLLEEVFALLPEHVEANQIRARVMLASLSRRDGTGVPEALHQWSLIEHWVPPVVYVDTLRGLLKLGQREVAEELAERIPDSHRFRHVVDFARQKGLSAYAGSWERLHTVEVDRDEMEEMDEEDGDEA